MAVAKMKMFCGSDPEGIETEINQWLVKLSERHVVQRTETSLALAPTPKGGIPFITISVWYLETSN
jgi:hypothetical protein